MRDSTREVEMNTYVTYSCGPLYMDEQRQNVQLGPTYNNSVPRQDVALKTYRKRCTIERGGGKHDDDDDSYLILKIFIDIIVILVNYSTTSSKSK